MFLKNKRGISAVVATVLIVLIVVAGVGLIWGGIIPLIKDNISLEDTTVSLNIDTAGGYTTWDESTQRLSVQVKRGVDDSNLSALEIIFSKGGNSKKEIVYDVPLSNQMKVYYFDMKEFGKPDAVKIAPIFSGKTGEVISELDFIPKGDLSELDSSLFPVLLEGCQVINESGYYKLSKNIDEFIGNCFDIQADNVYLDLNNKKITGKELKRVIYSDCSDGDWNFLGYDLTEQECYDIGGVNYELYDSGVWCNDLEGNYFEVDNLQECISSGGDIYDEYLEFKGLSGVNILGRENISVVNGIFELVQYSISLQNSEDIFIDNIRNEKKIITHTHYENISQCLDSDGTAVEWGISYDECMDLGGSDYIFDSYSYDYGGINLRFFNTKNSFIRNIFSKGVSHGVYLYNSNFNVIENVFFEEGYYGVYLYSSSDNDFKNINVKNGSSGIYLYRSNGNSFDSGVLADSFCGINIQYGSSNNIFNNLTCEGNKNWGVYLGSYISSWKILGNNLLNSVFCNNKISDVYGGANLGTGNVFTNNVCETQNGINAGCSVGQCQ